MEKNVLFNLKVVHNEVPQTDHTVYLLLRLPKLRRKRIISIENDERTTWYRGETAILILYSYITGRRQANDSSHR